MPMEQGTEVEGKFLPVEYESRIFDAVNGLRVLRRFFSSLEVYCNEEALDAGEQNGVAWILTQVINELHDTALNCGNGRRA